MASDEWVVDFPTLGFLAADWIEAHCFVPSGFHHGDALVHDGWQIWCTVNHYRVRPGIEYNPNRPLLAGAFVYRRSIIVGPQKCGKSPWGASIMLFEAVGPCLFAGWARGGELYECAADGCACGFVYEYSQGEPMGMMRTKTLMQLVAVNEDQVGNVYEPMQTSVRLGPLEDRIAVRENFLRLPNDGEAEASTSGTTTKIGRPINAALADETGQYTRRNRLFQMWQHMRRGLAGMGGRAIELTNAWDPADASAAQVGYENSLLPDIDDIFVYWRQPPANLSYKNKRDRAKIHRIVYEDSPWVNLDDIEAEAAELLKTDPEMAERYYGNRAVQGKGAYMTEAEWNDDRAERASTSIDICLGFDGSRSGDWTGLRAETEDGYRFTPTFGPDSMPTFWNPEQHGGRIPRSQVDAAVREIFAKYNVKRFYVDPRHWETQADAWALEFGEDRVTMWPTNQLTRMHDALVRYLNDVIDKLTHHDGCATTKLHMLAARKKATTADRYTLEKPSENQKIDMAMADVLAHEAASDARAEGWDKAEDNQVIVFGR